MISTLPFSVLSNVVISVKNRMREKEWEPDGQTLKQFFDTQQNQFYRTSGTMLRSILIRSSVKQKENKQKKVKKTEGCKIFMIVA